MRKEEQIIGEKIYASDKSEVNDELIYLACPYGHDDPHVMEWRWEACRVAVADLLAEGRLVYSPVLHNHPILKYKDLGRHWDFWARYDSAMLKKCDKLYVYKLDGWMDSVGLLAETKIAAYSEIPIFSYKNELCNYTVTQIDHPGYYVNSI